jgi:flagellar motor switch protein FliN/FliY
MRRRVALAHRRRLGTEAVMPDPSSNSADTASGSSAPAAAVFPNLSRSQVSPQHQAAIDMLRDVNLQVRIELGRTRMLVEDVLRLSPDSIVELDKAAGDPVDIYVNGRHIARGEVLVLNEAFCVRVSEIIEPLQPSVESSGSHVTHHSVPKSEVA